MCAQSIQRCLRFASFTAARQNLLPTVVLVPKTTSHITSDIFQSEIPSIWMTRKASLKIILCKDDAPVCTGFRTGQWLAETCHSDTLQSDVLCGLSGFQSSILDPAQILYKLFDLCPRHEKESSSCPVNRDIISSMPGEAHACTAQSGQRLED